MTEDVPDYDILSLAAIPLTLKLKETGTELGIATGFIYVYSNQPYLITNWHVVTGLNPKTRKPIASHGGIPDIISFPIIKRKSEIQIEYFDTEAELFDPRGIPFWRVHPANREEIDVVALPIRFDPSVELFPLTDNKKLSFDIFKIAVADEVIILGFPFGLKQLNFPLWKRGTIATEPNFEYEGLPLFLVDTATRPGMSGAPVFVRKLTTKDGRPFFAKQFVGVYSGRYIGETEIQAQLGRVWKRNVIDEIIIGDMRDVTR